MAISVSNGGSNPTGHAWLRRELNLAVPPPAVESYVVAGARRTEVHGRRIVERYRLQYATAGSIVAHLRFALRHEPIDLGVLVATLKAIEAADLEAWVRAEPTGAFSRRAWFFYETFTGRMLDLDDARTGNYVPALDPGKHIVGESRRSRRHRVADNLLGGAGLCPTVRRTPRLTERMDLRVDRQAWALIENSDAGILARAVVGWRCSCGSACKTAAGCPRPSGAYSRSSKTATGYQLRRRRRHEPGEPASHAILPDKESCSGRIRI